jgi:hypothetical protein
VIDDPDKMTRDHHLCDYLVGMFFELPGYAWPYSAWEIGSRHRAAIGKLRNFGGRLVYDPKSSHLCGRPVRWTRGAKIEMVVIFEGRRYTVDEFKDHAADLERKFGPIAGVLA